MTYSRSLDYLYSLQKFGIKLGLRKTRSLLGYVGNPQDQFPSIHIAGTNGKGSTAAMIASILQEAGYKAGLYTSPHLINFTERIRVNGQEISPGVVAYYTEVLRPKIDQLKCTFFEATTAIAFMHFASEKVDVAVVETGLGGRLDATNVLRPLLTIITTIALEHTEHLGNTITSIAREKAGIIKPSTPCIVGNLPEDAREVVRHVATSRRAPLLSAPEAARVQITSNTLSGLSVKLTTTRRTYDELFIGMSGSFQAENARLAILASEALSKQCAERINITQEALHDGLRKVRKNSGIRGRLEVVKPNPRVIIDVAHNPDAVARLAEALDRLGVRNPLTVFGVMRDKNYSRMLQNLRAISDRMVAVAARIDRSLEVSNLAFHARRMGFNVTIGGTVRRGLLLTLKNVRKSDSILITGSHYVVGEALEFLEKGGS